MQKFNMEEMDTKLESCDPIFLILPNIFIVVVIFSQNYSTIRQKYYESYLKNHIAFD